MVSGFQSHETRTMFQNSKKNYKKTFFLGGRARKGAIAIYLFIEAYIRMPQIGKNAGFPFLPMVHVCSIKYWCLFLERFQMYFQAL